MITVAGLIEELQELETELPTLEGNWQEWLRLKHTANLVAFLHYKFYTLGSIEVDQTLQNYSNHFKEAKLEPKLATMSSFIDMAIFKQTYFALWQKKNWIQKGLINPAPTAPKLEAYVSKVELSEF